MFKTLTATLTATAAALTIGLLFGVLPACVAFGVIMAAHEVAKR